MNSLIVSNVPTKIEDLNQEQLNYILSHIQYDKLKSQVEKEVIKASFDTFEQLENYLTLCKKSTASTYRSILVPFLSTHNLVDMTRKDVDRYVLNLEKEKLSTATIRLRVSAISGFVRKLVRWGFLTENVWTDCYLPDNKRAKELEVPSIKDISTIMEYYVRLYTTKNTSVTATRQKESARKMIVAIKIMTEIGLRVGAISGMKIKDGKYETYSKGKTVRGEFTIDVERYGFDLNEEFPFAELNDNMIKFNIARASDRLLEDGSISCHIHPHSFRHYYAVNVYKSTKDIYAVSRLLGHSGVNVTQRYLESLESVL